MPAATDVANYALDLVGERYITSIDETSDAAMLCKRNLERVRDELQREFPWKTFIVRAELSADGTAPTWGPAYRYAVPSETMRVIDVYSGDSELRDWQMEGGYILCDVSGPLQIRYIKRNTDINRWDPLFLAAVAHRLAIIICEKITNSTGKKQDIKASYMDVLRKAQAANAFENAVTPVNEPSDLELARINGFSPSWTYRSF